MAEAVERTDEEKELSSEKAHDAFAAEKKERVMTRKYFRD